MSVMTQLSDLSVDGVVQSTAQGIFIGSATAMPTASTSLNGVMVLYVGTSETYQQNTFYMCNGTSWNQVNVIPDYSLTPNTVVVTGADGNITVSPITTTELGYLDGTTSNIQAQFTALGGQLSNAQSDITTLQSQMSTANGNIGTLQSQMSTAQGNITTLQGQMSTAQSDITALEGDVSALQTGKQDTITGGATSIATNNLTASRALVSDSSGKVAVSAITSTELGYLDGADSNIQNQLDTLASQISALTGFNVQVVSSLPSTGVSGTMYFVPSSSGSGQNIYDEYLYVNGAWEQVGSTAFSLSIVQDTSGITINGTALQDASASRDGLMTASRYSAITTAQNNISTLQSQMSTAQSDISDLELNLSTTLSRVSTCESDISSLESDVAGIGITSSGNTATVNGKSATVIESVSGSVSGNDLTISVNGVNSDAIALPNGGSGGSITKGTFSSSAEFLTIASTLNQGDILYFKNSAMDVLMTKNGDGNAYTGSGYIIYGEQYFPVVGAEISEVVLVIKYINSGDLVMYGLDKYTITGGFYIKFT